MQTKGEMAMENTNKEKAKFPYQVEQKYAEFKDDQCCWQKPDHTSFHFFRCPKPEIRKIDNIGLCERHASSVEIWRNKTCKQN